MNILAVRQRFAFILLTCALAAAGLASTHLAAQSAPSKTAAAAAQKIDAEYTAKIKAATPDARILTELVDHMPASDKVPSPLKFFGYIPGEPGHLTYHKDIVRYYEALEQASPRVKLFKIGVTDEGRDMVALAVADEVTINQLDKSQQKNPGKPAPGMVYWGKYVQHDNNRDGIGVGLKLTQHMLKSFLDWHPTVFHDLHESVTLLHVSTGTGPYNTIVDPIQVDEWWILAQTEMMEMTKRDVPGVWTYNYYDGWVPNYLFWIGVTHNSIGRFYETQSFRGANYPVNANQSREWYRPNPTPNDIMWGPRANVNMQQSAILIAMNHVAKNKETFLENYYLKNKHTVERGKSKAPYAYVIPAAQRRRVEAAELMNLIRREGAEVHTATTAFSIGCVH